jgi:hypothetical protein
MLNEPFEVGRHRLLCGDLTQGACFWLMGGVRADVVYSDPPWGPGNQKYWHTMNDRGSAPRTDWPVFLAAFCKTCAAFAKPEGWIFVEMGLRWIDELDAAMAAVGRPAKRRWAITYGPRSRPLPNTLSLYGEFDLRVDLAEPHGESPTRQVLGAVVRPGVTVLDPCTGLGMTARTTHRLGGTFFGLELNPRRLERTRAWLAREAAR